jgi:hypothetical protein
MRRVAAASAGAEDPSAPETSSDRERAERERLETIANAMIARRARRARIIRYALIVALALAAAVAAAVPRLRQPIALIGGGFFLLYLRSRFFKVPGVAAVPMGRARGGLFGSSSRGGPGAARGSAAHGKRD